MTHGAQKRPSSVRKIEAERKAAERDLAAACPKCDGAGWLWWNELTQYDGPANATGQDDTRYPCDGCQQ